MKSCSKKILIDMIKPKKNTMHLLCRLTPPYTDKYDWMFVSIFMPKNEDFWGQASFHTSIPNLSNSV